MSKRETNEVEQYNYYKNNQRKLKSGNNSELEVSIIKKC